MRRVLREKFVGAVESFKKYVTVHGRYKGKMRGQCYKENKAAKVFWDAIPDAEMEAFSYSSIESFVAKKWNGNCVGAWKLDYTSKQYNDV